jgi:hypothetical protein
MKKGEILKILNKNTKKQAIWRSLDLFLHIPINHPFFRGG